MDTVTLYVTESKAIRKTADNCRRIMLLYDALRIQYKKEIIDTKEMMGMITELSGTKELPQTFVGDKFVGNYDKVFAMNEEQKLPVEFRRLGYAGDIAGGENIPVADTKPQVIKKKVIKKVPKKKKDGAAAGEDEDDDAPPPPPPDSDEDGELPDDDDDEAPPPPPPDSDEDDGGEDPPPPPDDDDE